MVIVLQIERTFKEYEYCKDTVNVSGTLCAIVVFVNVHKLLKESQCQQKQKREKKKAGSDCSGVKGGA